MLSTRVKWLRRAADQGIISAKYFLGNAYDTGEGVLEDDKEAIKWFSEAALQGHSGAQLNLGVMYARGEGIEEDIVVAYTFWNFAAANGEAQARKNKEIIVEDMTAAQIEAAQEMSRALLKKFPLLLNR